MSSRLEAIATRVEAIAIRVEAMSSRLEAIATRVEATATRVEAIDLRLEAIVTRLEAKVWSAVLPSIRKAVQGRQYHRHNNWNGQLGGLSPELRPNSWLTAFGPATINSCSASTSLAPADWTTSRVKLRSCSRDMPRTVMACA